MSVEAKPGFRASLCEFLYTRFDAERLRDLAAELPAGVEIRARLTTPASCWTLAGEIVELVSEYRQLDTLRASLLAERPDAASVLEAIWSLSPEDAVPRPSPSRCLPALPIGFIERPEYVALRAALREGRPVVGITGLPGSGKTTAVTAALQDARRALRYAGSMGTISPR